MVPLHPCTYYLNPLDMPPNAANSSLSGAYTLKTTYLSVSQAIPIVSSGYEYVLNDFPKGRAKLMSKYFRFIKDIALPDKVNKERREKILSEGIIETWAAMSKSAKLRKLER